MPAGEGPFEVGLTRVRRERRRWPAAAATGVAVLVLVVVAALAGNAASRPAGGIAVATDASTDGGPIGSASEAPPAERQLPAALTCHAIVVSACRLAARAALGSLGDELPAVISADVWTGLVCGDNLDCPPTRVNAQTAPLANVILHLAGGGPAAWVNVVALTDGRPTATTSPDPALEAWIARWQELP